MNTQVYQLYNNTLCIAASGVIKSDDNPEGIISKEVWQKLPYRHGAKVLQKGGNGRTSLIAWNTVPGRFQEEIKKAYGDPEKTAKKSAFMRLVNFQDVKAATFFMQYEISGKKLDLESQKLYISHAVIFDAVKIQYKETQKMRARHGKSMNGFWESMTNTLHRLKNEGELNHKLPRNPVSLKRKYEAYLNGGYETLISAKLQNDNRKKMTGDIEGWIVTQMCSTRLSIDMIHHRYLKIAESKGWRTDITAGAFRKYVTQKDVVQLIALKRHGVKSMEKTNGISHSLKKALYANDVWMGDGTGTGWAYRTDDNAIGYATTYFVLDGLSEKILACPTVDHVNKETAQLQADAFSEAIRNAGYCKPYQIILDNQKGHKTTEVQQTLKKITRSGHVTHSRAYRPQGRSIERIFGQFQEMMLARFFFWTGFGRHTHSDVKNAPNTEDIKKNIHDIPTFQELQMLLEKIVDEWNNLDYKGRKTPNEIYDEHRDPTEQAMTLEEISQMFWREVGPVTYRPEGIKFQYKNQKYHYEVYDENGNIDFAFRKQYLKESFYIRFDPEFNHEEIFLVQATYSGKLQKVAVAKPKREISRSMRYHEAGDVSWANEQMRLEKEYFESLEAEAVEKYNFDEQEKRTSWRELIGQAPQKVEVQHNDDDDEDIRELLRRRM